MLLNQSRYPEIAYKQSLGILSFVRLYSSERLEKACMRASTYHKASFHTVSNILKNRLDMVEEEEEEETGSTPEHGNIRGADSYH